jgi:YYY domain-containing protein
MIARIFIWWFVVQVMGIIALPLSTHIFRSLPDRGYALSKSMGLLLVSYLAWLLAMLGLGSFGVFLIILSLIAVGGIGILMRGDPRSWREPVMAYLRAHWPRILITEVVFLVALGFVAWLRAHHPDPWGTERPMDFGFFNAIQRSNSFPPSDPWLAGYSINYYYFGYLMHSVVALLSGLQDSVAFNLSLSLVFALTAINIVSLVGNLIALTVTRAFVVVRWLVVVASVFIVLIAGNQAGALQVITGDYRVVALDGGQLVSAVMQSLGGDSSVELSEPVRTNDFQTFEKLDSVDRVENFNWWWPSRALWDDQPQPQPQPQIQPQTTPSSGLDGDSPPPLRLYNITEFPFFSFWLGDMHPHVMALPFGLLAMALALTTLARSTAPAYGVGREGWSDLLAAGLILGSLYVINSWDLPTYTLLYGGALFLLFLRTSQSTEHTVGNTAENAAQEAGEAGEGAEEPAAAPPYEHVEHFPWMSFVKQGAMVFVAMIVLFLPFFLTFNSLVGSAEPLVRLPFLSKLTQIIAPYQGSRTGLHAFLIIFGLFFIPLLGFLYLGHLRPAAAHLQIYGAERFPMSKFLPWLGPLFLVIGLLIGFPMLMLVGVGVLAFQRAMNRAHRPAEAFTLLVIALGCAIVFGTDLIYIRDVFNNRMNTIFKFYYQVWLLWGTVAGYAVWWLLSQNLSLTRADSEAESVDSAVIAPDSAVIAPDSTVVASDSSVDTLPSHSSFPWRWWGRIVAGAATVLLFLLFIVGAMVYPTINLRDMAQEGTFKGLEGVTPREHTSAGKAAIAWLREHAKPGSVILEMVAEGGGSYNPEGYAGVSAATGIPTVLGWVGHERQWRGGDSAAREELEPRRQAVQTIYETTDIEEARTLLERYHVDYVYVGELERRAYDAKQLAKFDRLGTVVFEQGDVTIYELQGSDTGQ